MSPDSMQGLAALARQTLAALGVGRLPDYGATRLRVEARTESAHAEVLAAIADFAPECGWTMQTSAVRVWTGGWDPSDGCLLAAEFANGGQSLHVRYGSGAWTLATLVEGEGEAAIAHGHRYQAIPSLAGQRLPGGGLHYRVYWRDLPEIGFRPFQARFIGFGE